MATQGRRPTPGPQQPQKYPIQPGPNYLVYGEQPGLIYDPYSDGYRYPAGQKEDYYQETGIAKKPETPPTLTEQLIPITATAAVGALGYYGAETLIKEGTFMGYRLWDVAKDGPPPVGGGVTAPQAPTVPQTPADAGAQPTGLLTETPAASTTGNIASQSVPPSIIPQGQPVPDGFTQVGTAKDGGALIAPTDLVENKPSGISWGSVGQGALAAAQLYTAYENYKEGDYANAGVNAVGATIAANAGLQSAGYAGSQSIGSIAPYAGPIIGAYQGYQTAKMIGEAPTGGRRNSQGALGGATAGAGIGSAFGPVGTAIGAVVGGTAGFLGSYYGSSKDKYQMMRDGVREYWKQSGILDENYLGTLADGSKFDFGKDGSKYGKLDKSDPNWGEYAAFANLIAAGEGLSGKSNEATATLLVNAASSNAGQDVNKGLANLQHFANQRGLTAAAVKDQVKKLYDEKKITDNQYLVWTADADRFLPGGTSTPSGMLGPQAPQRSQTSSPGIDLQGRPIQYKNVLDNVNKKLATNRGVQG